MIHFKLTMFSKAIQNFCNFLILLKDVSSNLGTNYYLIDTILVTGRWAGFAIAHPGFGRIEGGARQWWCTQRP
jgi:hypothetical protein